MFRKFRHQLLSTKKKVLPIVDGPLIWVAVAGVGIVLILVIFFVRRR
ncbi:MAG: hypothetical protein RTV41_12035 [Candidatus Thorarchaeota archaeon]